MSPSPQKRRFVAPFAAVVLVSLLLAACDRPDATIGIRIRDFLDDLAAGNFGSDMERHFHPDADVDSFNTEDQWNDSFLAGQAERYEWREASGISREDTDDYDDAGAIRVVGRVFVHLDDGETDERAAPTRFVVRQDGSDWLIRAIELDDDQPGAGRIQ